MVATMTCGDGHRFIAAPGLEDECCPTVRIRIRGGRIMTACDLDAMPLGQEHIDVDLDVNLREPEREHHLGPEL
jgi:hypothetical protein